MSQMQLHVIQLHVICSYMSYIVTCHTCSYMSYMQLCNIGTCHICSYMSCIQIHVICAATCHVCIYMSYMQLHVICSYMSYMQLHYICSYVISYAATCHVCSYISQLHVKYAATCQIVTCHKCSFMSYSYMLYMQLHVIQLQCHTCSYCTCHIWFSPRICGVIQLYMASYNCICKVVKSDFVYVFVTILCLSVSNLQQLG